MELTEKEKTFVNQKQKMLKSIHEKWALDSLERALNMEKGERRDYLIDFYRKLKSDLIPTIEKGFVPPESKDDKIDMSGI